MKKWQKILFVSLTLATLLCSMVIPSMAYTKNDDGTLGPSTVIVSLQPDNEEQNKDSFSGVIPLIDSNWANQLMHVTIADNSDFNYAYYFGYFRFDDVKKEFMFSFVSQKYEECLFTVYFKLGILNSGQNFLDVKVHNYSTHSPFLQSNQLSIKAEFFATPTSVNNHINNLLTYHEQQIDSLQHLHEVEIEEIEHTHDLEVEELNRIISSKNDTISGLENEIEKWRKGWFDIEKLYTQELNARVEAEKARDDYKASAEAWQNQYEYAQANLDNQVKNGNIVFRLFSGIATGLNSLIQPILGINLTPGATTAVTVGTFVGFAVIALVVFIVIKITRK